MSDTDLLRELHETYVWEVNSAVGEGRMDLVWELADEYTERALQLITQLESPGCGRIDCVVCARPVQHPPSPMRRRWPWSSRRRGAA